MEFIKEEEEDRLTKWLLKSFDCACFAPLVLADDPSPARQLQLHYFEECNKEEKKKFRNIAAKAIKTLVEDEWSELKLKNAPNVLRQLACLTAYIKESEAIELLVSILKSKKLNSIGKKDYKDTVQIIVAVIAGFASPSKEIPKVEQTLKEKVKRALKELFFEMERLEPFSAQLFVGLCICEPKNYIEYVPRFLDFVEKRKGCSLRLDFIMSEFRRVVSLETINKNLQYLEKKNRDLLLDLLIENAYPHIKLYIDRDRPILVQKVSKAGDSPRVFPIEAEEEYTEPIFETAFKKKEKEMAAYGGPVEYLLESLV